MTWVVCSMATPRLSDRPENFKWPFWVLRLVIIVHGWLLFSTFLYVTNLRCLIKRWHKWPHINARFLQTYLSLPDPRDSGMRGPVSTTVRLLRHFLSADQDYSNVTVIFGYSLTWSCKNLLSFDGSKRQLIFIHWDGEGARGFGGLWQKYVGELQTLAKWEQLFQMPRASMWNTFTTS